MPPGRQARKYSRFTASFDESSRSWIDASIVKFKETLLRPNLGLVLASDWSQMLVSSPSQRFLLFQTFSYSSTRLFVLKIGLLWHAASQLMHIGLPERCLKRSCHAKAQIYERYCYTFSLSLSLKSGDGHSGIASYLQSGSNFLIGYLESINIRSKISWGNMVTDDKSRNSSTEGIDLNCLRYYTSGGTESIESSSGKTPFLEVITILKRLHSSSIREIQCLNVLFHS